jgi:hypothetical protein
MTFDKEKYKPIAPYLPIEQNWPKLYNSANFSGLPSRIELTKKAERNESSIPMQKQMPNPQSLPRVNSKKNENKMSNVQIRGRNASGMAPQEWSRIQNETKRTSVPT